VSDEPIRDMDERLGLLREKADREGIEIPDDVLEYIAGRHGIPQTLKGALVQVTTYATVKQLPIDLRLARLALGDSGADSEQGETGPRSTSGGADADSGSAAQALWNEDQPLAGDDAAGPNESYAAPRFVSRDASEPVRPPAQVFFTPVRTKGKKSLVTRAGQLLDRAGLTSAVDQGDLVAVKIHFGEKGNTGFVQPIFLREVVSRVKSAGGKPFLTDSNTLYRGQRFNAVDHLTCAIHNGFTYATVEAPVIIADGLDGRDSEEVAIEDFKHFDMVRIGSAAIHADAMVVVSHVKGHEATGFGGALKNVGMGLGCRSAKQRMHADFSPDSDPSLCTGCNRCVQWCPVNAIAIGPDRVAVVDREVCYGCGECVAACPHGAIAIEWKTTPDAIQEKIVEHVAGAVAGKDGKVVYLSFVNNVSPDCDCWNFSDASVVPDIGVLASADPVAIDQAAYDLVAGAPGLPGTRGEGMGPGIDTFREITGIDGTVAMRYAESTGLGTRTYELITVD